MLCCPVHTQTVRSGPKLCCPVYTVKGSIKLGLCDVTNKADVLAAVYVKP